jgi:predicted ATP-grasp superfamily ATP-dependent carboligase
MMGQDVRHSPAPERQPVISIVSTRGQRVTTARSEPIKPPVLVLGAGLTALGTMRLLNRAGYMAYAVSSDSGIERWSRYWRVLPPAPGAPAPEHDLAGYLAALPVERAVLIPCSDAWARHIAELSSGTKERFSASISSADTMGTVTDKWRLARTLQTLGLPHPDTMSLEKVLDAASLPRPVSEYFVKPHDSARFFAHFGAKAFRISSADDLARSIARARSAGVPVLLQRYIPGPPENHIYVEGFIDRHGGLRAIFLRRRLRMHPADFGNSTCFESIPPDAAPDAVTTISRLLRHVGYRGIFSAEFKRDESSGVHYLIEVNARPWWYVEFAGQCGVNVCEMAVRDALGQPVPAVTSYAVGRRCVYPYYDYSALSAMRRNGRIGILDWIISWTTSTQPEFRWSDPLPAIRSTLALARGWISHRLHRAAAEGK